MNLQLRLTRVQSQYKRQESWFGFPGHANHQLSCELTSQLIDVRMRYSFKVIYNVRFSHERSQNHLTVANYFNIIRYTTMGWDIGLLNVCYCYICAIVVGNSALRVGITISIEQTPIFNEHLKQLQNNCTTSLELDNILKS